MKKMTAKILLAVSFFLIAAFSCPSPAMPDARAQEEPVVEFKPQKAKDPFRKAVGKEAEAKKEEVVVPIVKPERPLPQFTVQGIFWGGRYPQAIIDDVVVKVGDTVKEAVIVDISRDGITVSFDNKLHTIAAPGIVKMETLLESSKGGKDEKK